MNRPVAAALAVVARPSGFLLVQRRNPPDAGLWGYPGGKIEVGESIMQAAARELLEETGVVARPLRLMTPFDVFHRGPDGGLLGHFILLPVLCEWLSGEGVASSDAQDAAWFDLEVMTQRLWVFSDHTVTVAKESQGSALHPLKAQP